MKLRVLVLLGTRPEVIKLAPVIHALRARPDRFETIVCSTGQHREMFDQAMTGFGLKADHDLGLMTPGQTLAGITSLAFSAVDKVLEQMQPHALLVQGDTTSAMVGAMCGFYRKVAVGHVEAGLRTGDIYSPFPEEVNRCVIGKVAAMHFAPTQRSADHLLAEGVDESRVFVTGNTVVDALAWMRQRLSPDAPAEMPTAVVEQAQAHRLILVTGHRRESFGGGIEGICQALKQIAEEHPDCYIVYPVHLNPNVQQPVRAILSDHPRIALLPPVAYPTLLWLMERAHLILSDSGGIQEEAPSFGKPLLVMRETTERPEVLDAGCAKLVGTDPEIIVNEARILLTDGSAWQAMAGKQNPFGDGTAADRICDALSATLV
jgi:UDP-N-acetylglucosamine 2-epimerase (non-hydrolysing)